ncbi:FUSC family protein [Salinimicrobium sp. ASW11-47]|nr:FUSC family protein [Salinimicrobium sediminilitoris]
MLSFSIALISIYGFRASLISFSGLLALVLSLAHDSEKLEIYQFALLIGVGGLWYLFLVKILYRLNPKAETEELMSETYELTAKFIATRGELLDTHKDSEKLYSKLIKLQDELTDNHEVLREILILSRKNSGWSNYQDKRLLIFVQLVEMLETPTANPVNYDRMEALFKDHPQFIKIFQNIIFRMSDQLQIISEAGNSKISLAKNEIISKSLEDARLQINQLRESGKYEEYLMLQNLLEYQIKQFKKLKRIKWLLGDNNPTAVETIDRKTTKGFIVLQKYDLELLKRNFNFKSGIFRHSFRLAVTIMIGYTIGALLPFQNPYWILLTIIVIMRPSYGLTKSRAKDRIIGTFIGGAIATAMVFLIQNPIVYGILGVASLVISLSMVQKNYKASATFITLGVIFMYAILQTDVLSVITFRILDTLVGAILSYVAMRWLLPTWEFVEIKKSIKKSVQANKDFFHAVTEYYQQKGKIPTSYKIARKTAFLETSNLNAAFQRMAQEPRSKQRETDKSYELVVLNHRFLASLASLSTYMQHQKTTEASKEFKMVTAKIEENLNNVLKCLNQRNCDYTNTSSLKASFFEEQIPRFDSLKVENFSNNLQEAHLVWEQLEWMFSVSDKMLRLTETLKSI